MKCFAFLVLLSLIPSLSFAAPALGYGSSTSVITAKIQEGFLSGFQLGVQQVYPQGETMNYVRIEQVHDGSPLGALVSASRLIKTGVKALVGFPGSTDSLLAGKLASEAGMLALFPGCNHPGLAALGPSVYSTGHSGKAEMWAQMDFAAKKLKLQRGLAIINPRAAPSAGMEAVLRLPETSARYASLKLDIVHLDARLKLAAERIQELKNGSWDFLLVTPYPEACVALVDQLVEQGIDLPVIAGSAWGTVDSDVMRRYVAGKRAPFYMVTSWLPDAPGGKEFRKVFRKKFAKEPTPDSAYGFDVGVIAATVLARSGSPTTAEKLLSTFQRIKCFERLSVGRLCFPPNGGHALRSVHLLRYTKKGFKPVAEFAP